MTIDPQSQKKLDLVFLMISLAWENVAEKMWETHQLQLKVAQGLRTFAQQGDLWAQGRKMINNQWVITDIKKIRTYAEAGKSFHNYGLALDSCFAGNDPYLEGIDPLRAIYLWDEYGKFCKEEGLTWGGDWLGLKKDRSHCEKSFGFTLLELQKMYGEVGTDGIWHECKNRALCGARIEFSKGRKL